MKMLRYSLFLDDLNDSLNRLHEELTLDLCPYLREGGVCVTGCRTEPRCVTQGPPQVARAARWVILDARALTRAAGNHSSVKYARDVMRWAMKLEVKAMQLEGK